MADSTKMKFAPPCTCYAVAMLYSLKDNERDVRLVSRIFGTPGENPLLKEEVIRRARNAFEGESIESNNWVFLAASISYSVMSLE